MMHLIHVDTTMKQNCVTYQFILCIHSNIVIITIILGECRTLWGMCEQATQWRACAALQWLHMQCSSSAAEVQCLRASRCKCFVHALYCMCKYFTV